MEQVYEYLTGIKFRQRVEAVIEKFNDMREDLDRERKFMGKQWSKREAQIVAAVGSTVGMVGDLKGIAGKAMPEISQPRHAVASRRQPIRKRKYRPCTPVLGLLTQSLPRKWGELASFI